MRKIYLTLMIIGFAFGLHAQNQTLETILENYYSVNGKQEYMKINSIIKEGYRIRNDIMPVIFYQLRPDNYMMKFDLADITAYRVYDGEIAWYTAPWRGDVNPVLFTDEQLETIIGTFAFDQNLYSWKNKGNSFEYKGKEIINEEEHFVLEFTDNTSNRKALYFINSSTYLLTKTSSTTIRNDEEVLTETYFSEYKQIDGIMFHFLEETYSNGVNVVSVEYHDIILNPKIEKDFFKIESHFEID
jgi:hypothetical protein